MQPLTVRRWLIACFLLDLVLLAVVVWDYFINDSEWIVPVLIVFVVFVIVTFILFVLAGRVRERVIMVEGQPAAAEPTPAVLVFRDVSPPIPPAPSRTMAYIPPVPPARPKAVAPSGPFVYNGYTLHSRGVKLNGGGQRTIYFFSKRKPKSGKPCAKPAGYHVGVNERTGLPFLKKGAGADGEDLTPESQEAGYRPQCSAVTADGAQCRNSARGGSKYCGSHFGYQPRTEKGTAKRIEGEDWSDADRQTDAGTVADADTRARVRGAPDTQPSVRKSWFRRGKRASA